MSSGIKKTRNADRNRRVRDVSEKRVNANGKKPSVARRAREKKDAYAKSEKSSSVQSVREKKNGYGN